MAFPGTYNFSYYRGDTFEFVISPKSANGTTFSLDSFTGSGSAANFKIATVRGSAGSPQKTASAVVNSTLDTVTCTITPTVGRQLTAGSYVYDVEIISTTGIIHTLVTGTINVTDDISGAV
jgi:hypothetical protein